MKNLLFVMAFMLFGFMGLAQDGGSCSCKGSSSCQVACPNGKSPECRSTLFGGCKCKCVDDGPINLEQAKVYELNSDLEDILELKNVLTKLENRKLIAELNEVIQFYEDNIQNRNFNQDFEVLLDKNQQIAIKIYKKLNVIDKLKLSDCEI